MATIVIFIHILHTYSVYGQFAPLCGTWSGVNFGASLVLTHPLTRACKSVSYKSFHTVVLNSNPTVHSDIYVFGLF